MTSEPRRFAIRVVVPTDPGNEGVEVRPLADGEDIVERMFDDGAAMDPRELLSTTEPLIAAEAPHEVRLAQARCAEGCCGALYVTIRRESDHVVWGPWRNPADDGMNLPELRFDAVQYRAEVERAVADRGWEWPARTVARLLEAELLARTDWLTRWECELQGVFAWPGDGNGDRVVLRLLHPGRAAITAERPWLQFQLRLAVSPGDDPSVQAARLADQLTAAGDPRAAAEVCGGSADNAEQLGYPWLPGSEKPGRRARRLPFRAGRRPE
ncbi:hypothetical protein [Streptomyces paludis]|uniref:hypothetical protein n=1 Tax=Streptomyces paludis TaxID=2282738 RepID=UPI0015F2C9A0|nr:hypothetical protein [Streptomyces paludis]